MLKLKFDKKVIDEYWKNSNYEAIGEYLKVSFKVERDNERTPQKYELVEEAIYTLHEIVKILLNGNVEKETKKALLKDVFRALRNYVINKDVQDFIITNTNLLDDVKIILAEPIQNFRFIDMVLQFLINLVINNRTSALKVYEVLEEELDGVFDEACVYDAAALMHNICIYRSLEEFDLRFYRLVFKFYSKYYDCEYLYFFMENFINTRKFWENYMEFIPKQRIAILEIIRNKQINNNDFRLNEIAIKTIIQRFTNSGDIIFQTINSIEPFEEPPYEVALLLKIIASLSSNEELVEYFKNDKDLFIHTGILLINIHRLGKDSRNCFTPLPDLRQPNDIITQHPAFGFKIGLIRIIGNLCWKNQLMQDLAREAELIPILLDCCNVDARNPFIMQWVIFAIRNLCENNLQNQEVIANLHQQGTVSSSTLDEMGLTLQSDGDHSIKIVPLDVFKK